MRAFLCQFPLAKRRISEFAQLGFGRQVYSSSHRRHCFKYARRMSGRNGYAVRDSYLCHTYNYGDVAYWDNRYLQEVGSFDWYQRYSALRPFVHRYIPKTSRILMVGCGNAVMSEDMVKDGYEEIVNIDISSVAINMMQKKYENVPQLKYIQMDVRNMSYFHDESFDSVIDKGTLDSLMCGTSAPISAANMLAEVSRLLKPGGVFMLITYGDPRVRMPHLNRPQYGWIITLYIIPRPGFERLGGSSARSCIEPVPLTEDGMLPPNLDGKQLPPTWIDFIKHGSEWKIRPCNSKHKERALVLLVFEVIDI